MLRDISPNKLNGLGLTIWQPRPFRHPETFHIAPEQVRINARCLVLLFCSNSEALVAPAAETKILNGMLGVLELPVADMMFATIYGSNPNLSIINSIITGWAPQTILQLSMEFAAFNAGAKLIQTYSPAYLLQHPEFKPQAYKALLNLRAILNGTS